GINGAFLFFGKTVKMKRLRSFVAVGIIHIGVSFGIPRMTDTDVRIVGSLTTAPDDFNGKSNSGSRFATMLVNVIIVRLDSFALFVNPASFLKIAILGRFLRNRLKRNPDTTHVKPLFVRTRTTRTIGQAATGRISIKAALFSLPRKRCEFR